MLVRHGWVRYWYDTLVSYYIGEFVSQLWKGCRTMEVRSYCGRRIWKGHKFFQAPSTRRIRINLKTQWLFFADWPSVHTYPINTHTENANFWKRSPEWTFLKTQTQRILRVDGWKRNFCAETLTSRQLSRTWHETTARPSYHFSCFSFFVPFFIFRRFRASS